MENVHSINSSQCGELERLAAAAASMDYTDSLSPSQNKDQDPQMSDATIQGDVQIAHSSRSINDVPQVISYIDSYHIPKGHHLMPLRPYEPTHTQHYIHEHSVQSIPGSRIVMVAGNNTPITNIQFARTASPYIVNDVGTTSYHNEDENYVQSVSYSQLLTPGNSQIIQYDSPNPDRTEENQNTLPNIQNDTEKKEIFMNKNKKVLKRKTRKTLGIGKEMAKKLTDINNDDEQEVFACKQCKTTFESDSELKKHQDEQHSVPKRNGLALELKIEIIKRINAGERKADMADEYGVNTSTIKTIMKKSDSYLNCWKKGMFNPDSKRLKGPKREDVEEALYSWYKQALDTDTHVNGPILCGKAQDFAKKLGHSDFKPTHGWLDRFKKRKKIVFGRSSSKRRRDDKIQEPLTSMPPQMLSDYEPRDIFAIELFGLCYRALPSHIQALKGVRCAGGVKSRERFSVVMCTNLIGSEKFPLLVVGGIQKNMLLKNLKGLPVHFIVDKCSWLTTEIMSSWLLDIDSYFVQQGRKVILFVPLSPLYSHLPKLRAIKFVSLPPGYPSPLRQVAVPFFKKYYRKKFLEELIILASRSKSSFNLHIPIIACLQFLSSSWQRLTENIIVSSFQRAGLTKYAVWGMAVPTDMSDLDTVEEIFHHAAHVLQTSLPPGTTFDDYVHFDDDVQVCNLMDDDDILATVKGVTEEEEYSDEDFVIVQEKANTLVEVEKALGVLRRYIQYQEGAQEMFKVLGHLEYFIYNNVTEKKQSNEVMN